MFTLHGQPLMLVDALLENSSLKLKLYSVKCSNSCSDIYAGCYLMEFGMCILSFLFVDDKIRQFRVILM